MSSVFQRTGSVLGQMADVLNALRRDAPDQPIDWTRVIRMYGMPKDAAAQVNKIFQGSGTLEQAVVMATAFVRGTDWYARTYPGIQQGINTGLFSDEQGYRSYKNQVDQLYRQYYQRPATAGEVGRYAAGGQDIGRVRAGFEAQAAMGTIADPLKSLFSPSEIQAFANQQSGIDSALGRRIAAEADMALRVDSLYRDFLGRSVTRNELKFMTQKALSPEEVARNFATEANIRAMDPSISSLFTPQEIQELARERAGGITASGQILAAQADLARQLNPLYHQYTGAGVSRQDVQAAYQSGESLEAIRARFAGQSFIDARRGDIQQTFGAFGGGQLGDDQLAALGKQSVGYTNPVGEQLEVAYEKAQRRMAKAFRNVVGRTTAALPYTQPADRRRADVGA